jgi:mono/diheme cytochrome c family protein
VVPRGSEDPLVVVEEVVAAPPPVDARVDWEIDPQMRVGKQQKADGWLVQGIAPAVTVQKYARVVPPAQAGVGHPCPVGWGEFLLDWGPDGTVRPPAILPFRFLESRVIPMRVIPFAVVLLSWGSSALIAQEPAPAPDGAELFALVCAMCHTVNPPPKAAPPISHASAYYLRKHADTETAVTAMVDYLKKPEAERSVLPAHAIERFGLMPSQAHLTDGQLRAVARYVLSLADTTHAGGHEHETR